MALVANVASSQNPPSKTLSTIQRHFDGFFLCRIKVVSVSVICNALAQSFAYIICFSSNFASDENIVLIIVYII